MENNSNEVGTFIKNVIKNGFKKIGRTIVIKLALPVLIILVILACAVLIKKLVDAEFRVGDKSNTPYMVSTFTNDISIDEDGNITTEKTAKELWDELIKHDGNINDYLDKPEELKKLIMAQLVTQYPDTRSDPDKEISEKDWEDINAADSKKVQGVIKFKRADTNGDTKTLTYIDPDTFQSYIDDYNRSGSEDAKKKVMQHFTIDFDNDNFADSDMGIIQGKGEFTQYNNLTNAQIKAIANLCQQEQGNAKGAAAEASLMANRFELYGKSYSNLYNYVRNCGWFANAAHFMDSGTSSSDTVNAVTAVLKNGKRTLPVYVDEHDCINPPDITSCTNNGKSFSTSERSSYKQYITKIKNRYGSTYTFFCFPTSTSDPFGYTNAKYRKKYGDAYYDFDSGNLMNGKNDSSSENNDNSNENNEKDEKNNNSNEGKGFGNGKLKWPTISNNITSTFGPRSAPIAGASTNHGAVDIGGTNGQMGEEVWACEDGKVLYTYNTAKDDGSEKEANGHAGNWVVIDHGNGYVSKYMHLQKGSVVVSPGQKVKKGDLIAKLGNSGNSTGPHLHFQIEKNGTKVDPMDFDYDKSVGSSSSSNSNSSSSSSGSKYNVLVATWMETSNTINSNDPDVAGKPTETSYSMTTTSINYQEFTSGYTMPFEYLWSYLVLSQDKGFTSELADLVYGSQIEITIHDNLEENTIVVDDTYTEKKKTETSATVNVTYGEQSPPENNIDITGNWPPDGPADEESTDYKVTDTTVTKTNTLEIALTKANVWIVDYEQKFTYNKPVSTTSTNTEKIDDIPYPETPDETIQNSGDDSHKHASTLLSAQQTEYKKSYTNVGGSIKSSTEKIYYSTVNREKKTTDTSKTTKYVSSPPTLDEKTDKKSSEPNFVTIFLKYEHMKAKNLILNGRLMLFMMLEQNDSTKNMIDLTKYLLYKATGKDYGVKEYDFGAFDPSNFEDMDSESDITGNTIQEKVWFALKAAGVSDVAAAGAMGNVDYESGGMNPKAIEGGYNEYNGGIGICQWTNDGRGSTGRNKSLHDYASSKGKPWQDEDIQVEFLMTELSGGKGKASGYATNQFMTKTYGGVTYSKNSWKTVKEDESKIEYATKAFAATFERPGAAYFTSSMSKRVELAKKYYKQFKGKTASNENGSSKGNKIVSTAKKYVGNPYVYGGSSLTRGCDCSHFVWLILKKVKAIPSSATYYSTGSMDSGVQSNWKCKKIGTDPKKAKAGDIITYKNSSGNVGHTAIYDGKGKIIEAKGEAWRNNA